MDNDNPFTPYPLLFEPVLKDYIWGGRNLAEKMGRSLPPGQEIAESWEIAAHPNGDVRVKNGPYAGQTLSSLTAQFGASLIGNQATWALQRDKFPLLIKLLDANRKLSVQVHPQDDYARQVEGDELGKTEMWVVLYAEEDASVILGVRQHTTPENFREALLAGALEQHLHEIPVQTGDFICVPSGSLHAILGGLLIAEVQQNSDVTYRVYDWNRMDSEGNSRPLHIEKALDVIDFEQREPSLPEATLIARDESLTRWELCRNQYFVVERVHLAAGATVSGACQGQSMEIWGLLTGAATLNAAQETQSLQPVVFTLLPATLGAYHFTAGADQAQLLRVYLQ